MLVLSRRQNDRVVFPTLGISVEILKAAGNKVRLGIDAPRDIPVLRHEIAESDSAGGPGGVRAADSRDRAHAIRNRVHTALMGLHVLRRKIESEDFADAEATIFQIFNELKDVEDVLAPSSPAASEPPSARSCRTLLVEDDCNERELMAGYLRMSGIEVDTAEDGLQAMAHLAKHERPDIVLMDMRMPRFDGGNAVAAIRSNPDYHNLKVFAVSGTKQSETSVDVGPGGVDRWFAKPVNPESIVAAIRETIEFGCVSA